ncbi:hypothetical protein PGB90_007808 [Kerria lacca]
MSLILDSFETLRYLCDAVRVFRNSRVLSPTLSLNLVALKQLVRTDHFTFFSVPVQRCSNVYRRYNSYDEGRDGFLDLEELKRMMEKIGAPQTHLDLKAMIKEVDEDGDNKISFREFLLIFRKANAGELIEESGLSKLAKLTEIDVVEVGVNGAKEFFEAKIQELKKSNKFEDEIRQEQEERRKEEEERMQRKMAFKEKAAVFQNGK